ncbi:NAD(P)-binding protein [Athelia psychrophila]|uniref:NAD(P)-binding protein n=1 Tax=Athelia psychrophila TaxID=1759441 RepID=A0A166R5I3_9AGAM|nr:NAD(P)-binding protein [Fibularhizoctonia sp. CBS 109695]
MRRWKNPEIQKEKNVILSTLSRVALRPRIESDVGLRPRVAKVMLTMIKTMVNTTTTKTKTTIRIFTQRGPGPPAQPAEPAFFPFAATRVLTVCAFSTNSSQEEVHARRFAGALRGPESDSINSAGFGVVNDLLVAIFSAFGEAGVQGVPGSRPSGEEDVGGLRSEACIGNVVGRSPEGVFDSGVRSCSHTLTINSHDLLTLAIFANTAMQVSLKVSPVLGMVVLVELVGTMNSVQQAIAAISDAETGGMDVLQRWWRSQRSRRAQGVAGLFSECCTTPLKMHSVSPKTKYSVLVISNINDSNDTCLITGANRGLGYELTKTHVARPDGAVLIAATRNTSKPGSVASLQALPIGAGSQLIIVKVDSAAESDAADAVELLRKEHGITSLNVVIANAGICAQGPVLTTSIRNMRSHFEVNAIGPLGGSIASMHPTVPFAAYDASQAAVNFIARKIHHEHLEIVAVALNPGFVQTDMGEATGRRSALRA